MFYKCSIVFMFFSCLGVFVIWWGLWNFYYEVCKKYFYYCEGIFINGFVNFVLKNTKRNLQAKLYRVELSGLCLKVSRKLGKFGFKEKHKAEFASEVIQSGIIKSKSGALIKALWVLFLEKIKKTKFTNEIRRLELLDLCLMVSYLIEICTTRLAR